jgi:hypothetical protein
MTGQSRTRVCAPMLCPLFAHHIPWPCMTCPLSSSAVESEATAALMQATSHGRYWGLAEQWLLDDERREGGGTTAGGGGITSTAPAKDGSPSKGRGRGSKAPELGPEVGLRAW